MLDEMLVIDGCRVQLRYSARDNQDVLSMLKDLLEGQKIVPDLNGEFDKKEQK